MPKQAGYPISGWAMHGIASTTSCGCRRRFPAGRCIASPLQVLMDVDANIRCRGGILAARALLAYQKTGASNAPPRLKVNRLLDFQTVGRGDEALTFNV
jgi:hypothetical protein